MACPARDPVARIRTRAFLKPPQYPRQDLYLPAENADEMAPTTRRQVLQAGGLTGLTSLASCAFPSGTQSGCTEGRTVHNHDVALPETAAWTTYQYDAGNSGHNPNATGPKQDAVGVAWRYSACIEAASGVAVRDGHVYAGGLVGNARTGTAQGGTWHGHMATPAITADTLFVGAFDLEARDPDSGALRWTFQTDVDAGAVPPPKVRSGTVFVPGSIGDPTLYAVHADRNAERWRYTTRGDIQAPAAVGTDVVVVVDDTRTLAALDVATGAERWTRSLAYGDPRTPPVIVDDHLYWAAEDGVHAMDTADGSTRWHQTAISGKHFAVADGTVYVAGERSLATLESATGTIQWETSTPIEAPVAPAIADGTVYLGEGAPDGPAPVVALDGANGEERWRVETRDVLFGDYTRAGVTQALAVVDEYVYVATAPGDIYAIAGQ